MEKFIIQIIQRFYAALIIILLLNLSQCNNTHTDESKTTQEIIPEPEETIIPTESSPPEETKTPDTTQASEEKNNPDTPPSEESPKAVYIFPFDHTEDHINVGADIEAGYSETRFIKMIPFLENLKQTYPDIVYNNNTEDFPIATFQFYGADAEVFEERNKIMTVKFLDQLKEAEKNNLIEIGYHGAHEPTERNNPTDLFPVNSITAIPNYLDAFDEFLNTWRHLICGFPYDLPPVPEPYESYCVDEVFPYQGNTTGKFGGLHKMTDVFFDSPTTDRLNTISGLNNDIWVCT